MSRFCVGLSTGDIIEAFREMYGAEVSAGLVSQVTNAVLDQVKQWQARPLDEVYPIVYLDCLVLKIRQDKRVIKKSIYLALGVGLEGHKELLGMCISENEGASVLAFNFDGTQESGLGTNPYCLC